MVTAIKDICKILATYMVREQAEKETRYEVEDKIRPVTKHEMNVAASAIHTSEIPPTISAFSRPADNKESISTTHIHIQLLLKNFLL